mmetsp:Transcript_742/g.1928  ORF Transcript_742/g.1928 Transcript_742/m.1928 type:complete len:281 (+) Transcript_742:224-1066(+)|eukprot:CAMPEP_0176021302 /NCGR_PEP_ID=MMETSP0120_2-20121206/10341_1 /TAXON_ID=160619 /ORGANISM="Kryptoperidinium foliaceum, Strain CCMP 1326" /LENGTH=280 /DNA_ID=CAMNT_0017354415 /DNA_START=194 /DNA_END=1036 /DNA_ORIENTATION=-
MKYLENGKLTELTAELSEIPLGESARVINGRIEAYTMKRAGNDKKYAHELGQKYVAEIEELQQEMAETVERRKRSASTSSVTEASAKRTKAATATTRGRSLSFDYFTLDTSSPETTLGDFTELSTRRLMTDLVLTLNASFPDYDFSNVKPSQFEKLTIEMVRKQIYERLSELASFKPQKDWLVELWMAVNDVVDLRECLIFKFEEEMIEEDALWSFHYFFVNKALRRIVFFTCSERIDEKRKLEIQDMEKVSFYTAEAMSVDDFDWDPAGGMSRPIPTVP